MKVTKPIYNGKDFTVITQSVENQDEIKLYKTITNANDIDPELKREIVNAIKCITMQ